MSLLVYSDVPLTTRMVEAADGVHGLLMVGDGCIVGDVEVWCVRETKRTAVYFVRPCGETELRPSPSDIVVK